MNGTHRPYSFIQLAAFQRTWKQLNLTDDDLISLEQLIQRDPRAAAVVPGAGSLREIRFAPPGWRRGKSGSLRVGFSFVEVAGIVYLISIYAKSDKENLSNADKARIRSVIAALEAGHTQAG